MSVWVVRNQYNPLNKIVLKTKNLTNHWMLKVWSDD